MCHSWPGSLSVGTRFRYEVLVTNAFIESMCPVASDHSSAVTAHDISVAAGSDHDCLRTRECGVDITGGRDQRRYDEAEWHKMASDFLQAGCFNKNNKAARRAAALGMRLQRIEPRADDEALVDCLANELSARAPPEAPVHEGRDWITTIARSMPDARDDFSLDMQAALANQVAIRVMRLQAIRVWERSQPGCASEL
mmetsp:Transcript_95374/g.309020  ORF Transcript_95374/g.309020 Transcript_95374/m.309020 type:complete len:197 (+) Transcript_95374:489-1079(+)